MNELPKPTKKAFHDLCILHNFHYAAQKVLAKAAGVHMQLALVTDIFIPSRSFIQPHPMNKRA